MPVTKKKFQRTWRPKLWMVLVVAVMYCGLAPHGVYAEDNSRQTARQQVPTSSAAAGQDSQTADNMPQKVLPPTLTLTLQDEDGQPISGVDVSAMAVALAGTESGRARTDDNGRAVFKHLKSGTYYFFANIRALRSHHGYDFPAIIKEIKSIRSYYISESRRFDISQNAECTYTIKRGACIMFTTFLDVYKPDKIVIANRKLGIGQNIPVDSTDFIQIYLPMRSNYQIYTVKDGDFDSWIIDFYAHEGLRIELL
jgi:hypothetical protein